MIHPAKRYDNHVHSDNSPDAQHSATYLCVGACEIGLDGIAITDHYECDLPENNRWNQSVRDSYIDCLKEKNVFFGRLDVLTGMEIGQPMQNLERANRVAGLYERDFHLASVHQVAGFPPFHLIDYAREDPRDAFHAYFNELMKTSRWEYFDSLAHLTYPLRYYTRATGKQYDLTPFEGKIEQILKNLADAHKALEVNTSGLRQELGDVMPSEYLLKRFYELGGEYVTIGSDAHCREDLAKGLQQACEILWRAGFRYTVYYKRHKPQRIRLMEE